MFCDNSCGNAKRFFRKEANLIAVDVYAKLKQPAF